MNKGKYVFSQLLSFLDPFVFLRISKKYGGDKYVKTFSCWNQLAVMMFGQLSNRESLRDLVLATHAHANKAFHLGFGKHASKSTLADANANRDYRIFEEFAYRVMAEARYMPSTQARSTCASASLAGPCSERRKEGSSSIPCMTLRRRSRHSSI